MAENRLKTFVLTGGEDFVTSPLEMKDGKARVAFNYEQNYDTGYTRISGYRKLVDVATPGEGEILGTVVFDEEIYIFRNKVGGATAGMWKATPATYDDNGVVTVSGSWIEVTDIVDSTSVATTLSPSGFYSFVIHNFKATVDRARYRGNYTSGEDYLIADIVTDAAGDLGTVGLNYECEVNHKGGPTMTALNWTVLANTTIAPDSPHDISGNAGNLYGVDSVNPAFEFNGTQLKQIDSTYVPDIPSHIEANGNRLALGFLEGEVAMSQLGNPFRFDPVYGAGSIGVSDFLTGLMAGPDGVLYVFAKNKTYLFYGMEGPLAEANVKKHNKAVGAHPFTDQMLAGHALIFDTWGLTELQATDQFGDVVTNSISNEIQPLYDKRQARCSTVLKSKSQYRAYFQDGDNTQCIIATMMQQQSIGFTHATYPFTIATIGTGEIGSGAVEEFNIAGTTDGEVYQLDKGNSFDGEEYNSYLALPFNFLGSPHRVKKVRKIMLNIEARADINIIGAADFSFGNTGANKDTFLSIVEQAGSRWGSADWNDFVWGGGFTDYVVAYVNGHGDNVAVTISSTSSTDEPHTLKDITFVYQYVRIAH